MASSSPFDKLIKACIKQVKKAKGDLKVVAEAIQKLIAKQVNRSFYIRVDPVGKKWPDLKPNRKGKILDTNVVFIRGQIQETDYTRRLANPYSLYASAIKSAEGGEANDKGFVADDQLRPWWKYQEFGTETIPDRSFWAFGVDIVEFAEKSAADKAMIRLGELPK